MKKQFFYAALAIGMMSSCSSNDLPGNQQPENPEDERVAIELGVSPLNTVVTTRGTGFVGNESDAEAAKWDKQPLNILMLKKVKADATKLEKAVDENDQYIFEGLNFSAPAMTADQQNTSEQNYEGKLTNDKGAVRYYPLTGAYDFFGWHFDDATIEESPANFDVTDYTYKITINGTQDIMVGKAELTETQKGLIDADKGSLESSDAYARAYSSWAARRRVQPIIEFKHLLSRLDFVADLGKDLDETDATINPTKTSDDTDYETAYGTGGYPSKNEDGTINNGVYVKSIKILDPVSTFNVTVASTTTSNLYSISNPTDPTPGTSFTLMQKPAAADGTTPMEALEPVNAGYKDSDPTQKVGSGIMIVPGQNSFTMEVELMQYVPVIDPADQTPIPSVEKRYEWKTAKMQTEVKLTGDKVFEAGKYYTVTITMYGFQKIEVHAELAAWKEGEGITSNPEDENFTTGE